MRTHVWFNLHRRCWSVKCGKERVRHARSVRLVGASFRVQEAARQRVLQERRRSVHAYVAGQEAAPGGIPPAGVLVSYNPYRGPTFYRKDTGAAVRFAEEVYFLEDGQAWAINPKEAQC